MGWEARRSVAKQSKPMRAEYPTERGSADEQRETAPRNPEKGVVRGAWRPRNLLKLTVCSAPNYRRKKLSSPHREVLLAHFQRYFIRLL